MAVTYEKTFEIEIINELSASVYNRVLNYVLNHELNKNDSQLLEVNLINQLKLAKRVNLVDFSLEELVQGKKAVESPTAFLLGGQPGSGKTSLRRR